MLTHWDRLERLEHIQDIRNLKSKYCRYVDAQAWEDFRSLFTDDCRANIGTSAPVDVPGFVGANVPAGSGFLAESADQLIDLLKQRLAGARSVHQVHEPEIELTGSGTASAIWPISDLVLRPPGSSIPSWTGYGYYFEDYVRVRGCWLISSLKVVRQRMDLVDASA